MLIRCPEEKGTGCVAWHWRPPQGVSAWAWVLKARLWVRQPTLWVQWPTMWVGTVCLWKGATVRRVPSSTLVVGPAPRATPASYSPLPQPREHVHPPRRPVCADIGTAARCTRQPIKNDLYLTEFKSHDRL